MIPDYANAIPITVQPNQWNSYTAPSNGYLIAQENGSSDGNFQIDITNVGALIFNSPNTSGISTRRVAIVPFAKGDSYRIYLHGTFNICCFVPIRSN